MTAATTFRILDGVVGLAPVDTAAVGYKSTWLAPAGATVDTATIAAYDAGSATWSCQVTEVRLQATASSRTETIEDTICSAGQEVPIPQLSTWGLVIAMYQDANYVALQQYAHDHDAEEVYFFVGFDGANPPKAIGRLYLAPFGDLGGLARVNLKTTVTWPVNGSPQVLYGSTTDSQATPPNPLPLTGARVGVS
jgi:hypothetical protein